MMKLISIIYCINRLQYIDQQVQNVINNDLISEILIYFMSFKIFKSITNIFIIFIEEKKIRKNKNINIYLHNNTLIHYIFKNIKLLFMT